MGTLIFLVVVAVLAYRCSTSEDRERLLGRFVTNLRATKDTAEHLRSQGEPYRQALRERMPRVVATPVLMALNVLVFILMLRGTGTLADPDTLIGWGGSVGPRTTNGEWWRLVTSMFVHAGFGSLVVNLLGLAHAGRTLERMVGRPAVAAVYFASGIFAGLWAISSYPTTVAVGASGAVFGLYGMLIAASVWSLFPPSAVTMPRGVAKRTAIVASAILIYDLVDGSLPAGAEFAAMFVGLVAGAALSKDIHEATIPPHRLAPAGVSTLVIAFVCAVPLHGIADVRPEIANVVALEDRTTQTYQAAAERFRGGRMNADALAQVIDRSIVPELQATDARLKALKHVPPEHQPLINDAEEYVRLRSESWRLRAEGLRRSSAPVVRRVAKTETESDTNFRVRAEKQHRGNMMTMAKAEGTERASLEALQRLKAPPAPEQR